MKLFREFFFNIQNHNMSDFFSSQEIGLIHLLFLRLPGYGEQYRDLAHMMRQVVSNGSIKFEHLKIIKATLQMTCIDKLSWGYNSPTEKEIFETNAPNIQRKINEILREKET